MIRLKKIASFHSVNNVSLRFLRLSYVKSKLAWTFIGWYADNDANQTAKKGWFLLQLKHHFRCSWNSWNMYNPCCPLAINGGGRTYLIPLRILFRFETSRKVDNKPVYPWGTPRKFGCGCAAGQWKALPYFRLKFVIFPTLFQTYSKIPYPISGPTLPYFVYLDIWELPQISDDN